MRVSLDTEMQTDKKIINLLIKGTINGFYGTMIRLFTSIPYYVNDIRMTGAQHVGKEKLKLASLDLGWSTERRATQATKITDQQSYHIGPAS